MESIKNWLIDSPLRFMLGTLLLALLILVPFDIFYLEVSDRKSLWIEAHGLLFDLLVFGVILMVYDTIKYRVAERARREREREERIERFQYEIDDFRSWQERASTLRIVGNVRRMNRLGHSKMNLSRCFLSEARLLEADLSGANLRRVNFRKAELWRAKLSGVKAVEANFEGAVLWGADLEKADLWNANLRGADLRDANLKGALLSGADLEGVKVNHSDWIGMLKEWEVNGAESIAGRFELEEAPIAFNTYLLKRKEMPSAAESSQDEVEVPQTPGREETLSPEAAGNLER